jgi:hypothetical protein
MPPKPTEAPVAASKPSTGEVKVEFAASNNTPPPVLKEQQAPSPVSKITTKSRFDIERELEELRKIAHGETPVSAKKGSSPEVVAQGDHERNVKVVLPPHSLGKSSQLFLDLQVVDGESRQKTSKSLRVDLPAPPADGKKRLKISIDLEEET